MTGLHYKSVSMAEDENHTAFSTRPVSGRTIGTPADLLDMGYARLQYRLQRPPPSPCLSLN